MKPKGKLLVIICGSVSTWIQKNILNHTNFLGRISASLKIEELSLKESSQLLHRLAPQLNEDETLNIMCITGGVPKYLEEADGSKSAESFIIKSGFKKDGFLINEFDKIFIDIFEKRAELYKKIIMTLVNGPKEFLQICNDLGVEKNGITLGYLNDLEIAGFVARDFSYLKNGNPSKFSKYRIKDNYLRFYLKYISPLKKKIEKNMVVIKNLNDLSNWNAWKGLQFESLLLNNLQDIFKVLEIDPSKVLSASPYFQKKTTKNKGGCQIDLLIQLNNKKWYVCEFKYKNEIKIDVVKEVQNKIEIIDAPKDIKLIPILIYNGKLDKNILKEKFFAETVPFKDLL